MMNSLAASDVPLRFAPGAPGRVVLLEDERERAHPLGALFTQEGHEVRIVGRDRDALQWLQQGLAPEPEEPPRLLVCNARMLGEGGLEVLARWCRVNPNVGVLLLGGRAGPKLRLRMARLPVRLVFDPSSWAEVAEVARELTAERAGLFKARKALEAVHGALDPSVGR